MPTPTTTLKWHPSQTGVCKSYELPGGLTFSAVGDRNKAYKWLVFVEVDGAVVATLYTSSLRSAKSRAARALRDINAGTAPSLCR